LGAQRVDLVRHAGAVHEEAVVRGVDAVPAAGRVPDAQRRPDEAVDDLVVDAASPVCDELPKA
jgi:hypothetical protein